jgi:uncharacterized sulfatase
VACLAAALLPWRPAAAAEPERWNLIAVVTDDQARWAVGAYGNRDVRTPNMDRLARQGARFLNAFVPSPVCSPSRATYLTGRHSTQLGITDYLARSEEQAGIGLPAEAPTWPGVLRRHGYTTALLGKWHLGTRPPFHPSRHGIDHFFGFLGGFNRPMDPVLEEDGVTKTWKGPIADVLTDHALHFLDTHRDRPFALLLHYREPHLPYGPVPAEDTAPYKDLDPTVPRHPGVDVDQVKRLTKAYYACVHAVDRNLGRLLAHLDKLDLSRKTIVLFTSDHGYMIGHHGLHTKGNAWWLVTGMPPNTKRPNLFEESIRVPLLVRWPGVVQPGAAIAEPVSNVDTFASVLGMLNVPVPPGVKQEGTDFTPLLRGRKVAWRDVTFGQYDLHSGALAYLRMARTDKWKLVRHYLTLELDELYNLEEDPGETRNLYYQPEHRAVRRQLQERLYAWQRAIDDPLLAALAKERDPAKK